MARSKRKSSVLEAARQRLAGLKSITSPAPNFGPSLTLSQYETAINDFGVDLDGYNEKLAALDDQQNVLEADELKLRELNRRMLAAAEGQYGPDSSQFEQAGGKRTSERKRPSRGSSKGTPAPTA